MALALFGASAPARADVDDFSFDAMAVDYDLTRDADGIARATVTETLQPRFPDIDQNRGLVRRIPVDYDGVPLEPTVRGVTDATGTAVPYTTDEDEGFLIVSIGDDDYVHGVQTYVIVYDLVNIVRHFTDTDTDEFYWDVNGTDWAQRFDAVTATVHVPAGLAAAANGESACYRGAEGDTGRCPINRITSDAADDGVTWQAVSDGALGAGQTMTVAVGFAPGTFTVPTAPARTWWATWLPLGAAAAALFAAVGLWGQRRRRWGDVPGREVIVPECTPPQRVDLAEGADLLERSGRWFPAAVLELAVRGVVRVVERRDRGLLGRERVRRGVRVVGLPDAASPPDRLALAAVVGEGAPSPGRVVWFDGPSEERAGRVARVVGDARHRAIADGLRARSERRLTPALRLGAWALSAAAVAVVGLVSTRISTVSGWLFAAGVVSIVAVVLCTLTVRPPQSLTRAGSLAREHIEGLRMYMALAEADRLRMLQSVTGAEREDADAGAPESVVRITERLLPWAVLWGVEESWGHALERAYVASGTAPTWLDGDVVVRAGTLAGMVHGLAGAADSAATAPSSGGSFSGGAGGGGSAGGGGGGGGGGGR
jgi:uncharacterized membrane protein YgcG